MNLIRAFGRLIERAAGAEPETPESRSFDFVCSTDDVDSYGEIVDQKSWVLTRFLSNPVCLWQHDRGQNPFVTAGYPIGSWSNIRVEGGALRATLTVSRATPEAETVYQLLKEGTLRAVSVGFLPGRIADEERDGQTVTVLYDCELFEISVVMVPANAAAVMEARTKAMADVRGRIALRRVPESTAPTPPSTTEQTKTLTATPTAPKETKVMDELLKATGEAQDACMKTDELATKCADLASQCEGELKELADELAEEMREASAASKVAHAAAATFTDAASKSADEATVEIPKMLASLRAAKAKRAKSAPVTLDGPIAPKSILAALGLEERATEADALRAVMSVNAKATQVDALAPRVAHLEGEIAKRDAATAEREIGWIVKCAGTSALAKAYGLTCGSDDKARRSLAALRKVDPAGFAKDFEVALKGLAAFDQTGIYEPITHGTGAAMQPPTTLAAKTGGTDGDDLERRADEEQAKAVKLGAPITRSEALNRAVRGVG